MNETVDHDGARLRRPSAVSSLHLGATRVSYVPDGVVQLRPRGWLPSATERHWAEYADHLNDTGHLVAGIGGLLVERGERALLIDTGFGPTYVPEEPDHPLTGAIHGGALLDNLARLGRDPAEIEAVAFTHLHTDHLGWACRQPQAFTAATFFVPAAEWNGRRRGDAGGAVAGREVTPALLDRLAPRLRLVRAGEEIFPGVRVTSLPGHTAGHAGYTVSSGGQRLIAFGDLLHSPLQIRHPEWPAPPDRDPGQAADHRRRLVNELTRTDTLGFGLHFPDVVFGRARCGASGAAVWHPEL
ncbi:MULTISPECIES: MBL fold metallo-hydrolase [unclassified Streptomyces]|uniref:MBL fold metallo-hydrolase n=1 Tax=unclassified Streptomyces TaxID=2593676 RepID=UPI002DD80475|nr:MULTISPECIES: MBL fold metallo-hydrolase [unclassified Streptomyces]WSA96021.1 MBL fold metallo-hydrolase [Streptomyces sp. NBC_01795]WSS11358.1 MBL fold metallo-hydrolase [Streptomyces sp. NBC_01186]WSS40068.1 MBL fold metallo-hydrolase [Streptomyces sp. NBC_01187]